MTRSPQSKVIPFEKLKGLSQALHGNKKRIVTTNGCFDLLHWGHIQYLTEAKEKGDVLMVGINSDRSVKLLGKGPERPICPEKVRALQIAALECVDYVCVFDEGTPERFMREIRPTIHVKGGDYKGKEIAELQVMKELGGKVEFLSLVDGFSTTKLVEKLKLLTD